MLLKATCTRWNSLCRDIEEPLTDDEFTHAQDCGDAACSECKYRRNAGRWHRKLRLPKPASASWLSSKVRDGKFYVGCVVCSAYKEVGALANYKCCSLDTLQMENFKKHESLASHQRSVTQLCQDTLEQEWHVRDNASFQTVYSNKITFCYFEIPFVEHCLIWLN